MSVLSLDGPIFDRPAKYAGPMVVGGLLIDPSKNGFMSHIGTLNAQRAPTGIIHYGGTSIGGNYVTLNIQGLDRIADFRVGGVAEEEEGGGYGGGDGGGGGGENPDAVSYTHLTLPTKA